MRRLLRDITIGATDGLTIPFALAAGLSNIVQSSRTVFISCMAVIVAYSITMTAGAYLAGRKDEPVSAARSAMIIGFSFLTGGAITVLPFVFIAKPLEALVYTAAVALLLLLIAGYYESQANGARGWPGALRVMLTGAAAAAAAYAVSVFFK